MLIDIGFTNYVNADRIVAVVATGSAPIRRMMQEARDRGMLVDATCGRKTRAVLVMDSGHVVASSVKPETWAKRVNKE